MLTTLALLPLLAPFDDYDGLRSAVVALGDIDGDGVPDLALAHRPRPFVLGEVPTRGWPAIEHEPVVWWISGAEGAVLHALRGEGAFGTELAAVGDLDGDGASDLAVGNGREESRGGAPSVVTVVSSGSGSVLARLEAPEGLGAFGRALAGGVQLTGDGTPDLVVGAEGGAFIVDGALLQPAWTLQPGADGAVLRRRASGFELAPLADGEDSPGVAKRPASSWGGGSASYAGMNVAALVDLDGDGLGEVALATRRWAKAEGEEDDMSEAAQADAATLVAFSGGEREPLSLSTAGWGVASGEDLDGDGVPDLVTTTVNVHTRAWSGATGELLWEVDYSGGYKHAEGASLGLTGDHDGDGVRDLVVGENETFIDADRGCVRVLSGATGKGLKVHRVESGERPEGATSTVGGADVAVLGDLDGDGLDELVLWEPVRQRLVLLGGADLEERWVVDVTALERPR